MNAKQVSTAQVDNTTGIVTGKLTDGESYTTDGPHPAFDTEACTHAVQGRRGHVRELVTVGVGSRSSSTCSRSW